MLARKPLGFASGTGTDSELARPLEARGAWAWPCVKASLNNEKADAVVELRERY
jgi:hypothetical protein